MEEARLTQHICFKTLKKESKGWKSKENLLESHAVHSDDVPAFKVDETKLTPDRGAFGNLYTPPYLPYNSKEKHFLFVPKMENRGRLTSTPNQEYSGCSSQSHADLENCNLSPTGLVESGITVGIRPSKMQGGHLNDIKGVLFPQHHHKDQSDMAELGITNLNQDFENFAKNIQIHESTCQDSGIGSVNVSMDSATTSLPIMASPLKRRADDGAARSSLESPMKRLAFMSLDNHKDSLLCDGSNLSERFNFIDTSQPGSLFLQDRCKIVEPSCVDELVPPKPIFANSIPFSPPKDQNHLATFNKNTVDDFKFMKPLSMPLRSRKRMKSDFVQTEEPIIGTNVGQYHFDIINGLAKRNLHHVITKIFETVRKKDVLRCSKVSSSWGLLCKENTFLRRQIKSLKKEYRNEELTRGSQNITAKEAIETAVLKSPAKVGPIRDLSTGRSVLGNLQTRGKKTLQENSTTKRVLLMPKTPSGRNYYVPAHDRFEHNQGVKRTLMFDEKLRPCPRCGWTAKIYGGGSDKGQCYRVECQFTFCTTCKCEYHYPEKCKINMSPPPMETTQSTKIGSKKSKQRLKKRLLM